MKFSELNLHPSLQQGITGAEYISCMPVQERVLTQAFSGQDLYVQSQTGTGKTAAFLIVIFQRLITEDLLAGKKALIMAPTRELAVQIEEEAKMLAKYLPIKIGSFYGGVGYTQQEKLLRENVQIMIGTPGRVLDLNKSGKMNLMEIAFLILDEADRMFDMGFYPDLRKLIRAVPPADRRQTMLFSATLNAWVKNLAWEYTRNPFEIAIEPETVTVDEVEQILYHVSSADKMKLLLGILKRENPESAIIFCNTKRYAEIVAKRLKLNGFDCEFIMGDLPQQKRLKIIDNIKAGKLRLLVATDVAARGLDIESLAMVFNYDIPNESENYVHRIGRTARAGKTGKAVSLASEQDVYELPGIERYIGGKIPSENATAELFAEDSSEGKYIQMEFYEERGGREERSRRREGPRAEAGRRGEARRGRAKPGESRKPGEGRPGRDAEGRGGERKKSRDPKRRSGRDVPRGNTREHDGSAPSDVKLSELSFDERMNYYRQKYDKGDSGPSDTNRGDANRSDAPRTGPSGKRRDRTGGRRERSGKRGREERQARPDQPGEETAGTPAAAAEQQQPKKGVLSKLLGVFRKK